MFAFESFSAVVSERENEPTFNCRAPQPTARCTIVTSSVSPERAETMLSQPAPRAATTSSSQRSRSGPGSSSVARPVAVIADPAEWDITADLTSNQLGLMEEGQGAEVTYYRDPANLPRAWALGTVEDAMQISDPPPYTSIVYNHFTGAEYSMELCFQGPVATEQVTWGTVKALYR